MERLYHYAVNDICVVFGITREELLASRDGVSVKARYIVIGTLCKYFTDNELVRLSSLSRSLVNKIRNTVDSRARYSFSFRKEFNAFKEKIATNLPQIMGCDTR